MPEISVLIPVYNAEPYLKESIDSILNQTFIDFEYLLIDKVIQSYQKVKVSFTIDKKGI